MNDKQTRGRGLCDVLDKFGVGRLDSDALSDRVARWSNKRLSDCSEQLKEQLYDVRSVESDGELDIFNFFAGSVIKVTLFVAQHRVRTKSLRFLQGFRLSMLIVFYSR